MFTSDNGKYRGEHRIPRGKAQPYEESIHVPLLVRGPRVGAGSITGKPVLNTAYFPSFMDLAGLRPPDYVDGRSLRPLLEGAATTWRSAILLERAVAHDHPYPGPLRAESLSGIRTSDGKKYIEY